MPQVGSLLPEPLKLDRMATLWLCLGIFTVWLFAVIVGPVATMLRPQNQKPASGTIALLAPVPSGITVTAVTVTTGSSAATVTVGAPTAVGTVVVAEAGIVDLQKNPVHTRRLWTAIQLKSYRSV